MDKPKITIADAEFLPYGKSESLGGDNAGIGPTYFEWEFADPKEARFVTDRYIKDARGEGQIAWLSEPFFLHPENYLTAMQKQFDAVLTHNQYFVDNMNWLWVPHGGSWVDFNLWKVYPKTKDVSIIVSNKDSTRGHRMRHEIVKEFGGKVDVFGLDKFTRKFDCIADYRYSIVVENDKCPGYFSEKLIDCFAVGTIPIYWGCPNIMNLFNGSGMLVFNNLIELERILGVDFHWQYGRMPKVVNMDIAENYRISEDWIYKNYPHLFKDGQNA